MSKMERKEIKFFMTFYPTKDQYKSTIVDNIENKLLEIKSKMAGGKFAVAGLKRDSRIYSETGTYEYEILLQFVPDEREMILSKAKELLQSISEERKDIMIMSCDEFNIN